MNLTGNEVGKSVQIELDLSTAVENCLSVPESWFTIFPAIPTRSSKRLLVALIKIGVLSYLLNATPTKAQILPDSTLPVNSSVINRNGTSFIQGGTTRGANLFHSFEQFSIATGSGAYFNNALNIQNIISRVTGKSVSDINGLIRANGTANLFLLNPNGIIFGPNASLNIGGSFLASTASKLNFADGTQFGTTSPKTTPLLTVSVPIGLQFGGNPAPIQVQGTGNNVIALNYQPIIRGNNSTTDGLKVKPQHTLAIVGGDVSLEGGILTAEGGRVELGSVDNGLVSLSPTTSGWTLGYERVNTFKDIRLTQRALVDASGSASGSIQLQGRRLQLSDGSLVLIQNQGVLPTGTIKINASESLEIKDIGLSKGVYSGIWNETLGFGDGGEIAVSTPELTLQSSGQIFSSTFGVAKAANITLSVPKILRVIGLLPTEIGGGSIISSLAIGSGKSGNIEISTGQLNLASGGLILTANVTPLTYSVAPGGSGDITINATNLVDVNGTTPNLSVPSAISAATFSTGQAGKVTVNTSRVRVRNGGRIDSSTTAFGAAGSVTINASDSVEVSGVASGANDPSLVTSAATILEPSLQDRFRLFDSPTGASGSVKINTGQLSVIDGGLVSVRNEGSGDAGTLSVNARSIFLDNKGSITAATASGEGGNITLNAQNLLLLRRGSQISATAGTAQAGGSGGNINIKTPFLVAVPSENSDISANAFEGNGGHINITAQGIFGIQPRSRDTPQSDITASSQLGINGTVQINTLDINPTQGLATLPIVPVDVTGLIAQGCPGTRGNVGKGASEFIITGRGGLPPQAGDPLSTEAVIVNKETLEAAGKNRLADETSTPPTPSTPAQIVEAQGWVVNAKGEVVLTAYPTSTTHYNSSSSTSTTCYAP